MRRFLPPGGIALVALAGAVVAHATGVERDFRLDPALVAELAASASPRDRALAADAIAQVDNRVGDAAAIDRRNALLAEAATAAPDDAFVQWLAYAYVQPATADSARKLVASDPGNGAVWMTPLRLATAANDTAGIDAALAGMAAATRYDEHFADYLIAWVDLYARSPGVAPPVAQAQAFARAAAVAIPAYKPLVDACTAPKAASMPASRGDACEASARLMTAGPTLIAQTIGHAVLRRSGRATQADAETERTLRWMIGSGGYPDEKDREDDTYRSIADWRETGNEIEVMRRARLRAGLPLVPPPDWTWTPPAPK
ncbi:MAG TPA: hypothetical protein VJ724_11010 [Tahibacter sp.]|nr:hypothetical protein [Tahibacter sp.]